MGLKGRMWGVIMKMYEVSRSAVLLEGECGQGVTHGHSLSPIIIILYNCK